MDEKTRIILSEMVSDEEINNAFQNANFGPHISQREVIRQGLLKCAGYWYQGHTSRMILQELKLITKNYKLSKKGGRYLHAAFVGDSNF